MAISPSDRLAGVIRKHHGATLAAGLLGTVVIALACAPRYETRRMDPRDCPPDPPARDTFALAPAPDAPGAVVGVVTDRWTGAPLVGAQVVVPALHRGANVDAAGAFRIDSLPAASYDLVVRRIGYASRGIAGVRVSAAAGVRARVPLRRQGLDECPGGFAVLRVRKPWWKWW